MITLEPMTEAEYQSYLVPAVTGYAHEIAISAAMSEEAALESAQKQYAELLPDGRATPNNYLFTIVDAEMHQPVGILWFALEERQGRSVAFVYDIRINEEHQRQGYGSQAFREMEKQVRALEGSRIALHVFGQNRGAQDMYTKLGYATTSVMMAKELDHA
jgi:ribosomal protein S18 acetylase RimI-like enzyme